MSWRRGFALAGMGLVGAVLALAVEAMVFFTPTGYPASRLPDYLMPRLLPAVAWTIASATASLLAVKLLVRWSRAAAGPASLTCLVASSAASACALALWLNAVESQLHPDARGGYVSLTIGFLLPLLAFASWIWAVIAAAISRTTARLRDLPTRTDGR